MRMARQELGLIGHLYIIRQAIFNTTKGKLLEVTINEIAVFCQLESFHMYRYDWKFLPLD